MKRVYLLWILATVLAIASVQVMGQAPRTRTELGSVSGTVIDHFTGVPIPDIAVTVKPSTGTERQVVTDQNGNFAIKDLPIGRYLVAAARDGFFQSRHAGGPVEVTLGAGQIVQNVRLQMVAYAKNWTLTRTPDGQPDLEGYWSSDSLTPMGRQPLFADKEFFTEQEAAEFQRREALRSDDDRGSSPAEDLRNNDGNQFWYPRATALDSRRTSLIVDPPNGVVPPFTLEVSRQRSDFLTARERAEGPESRDRGERCLGLSVIRRLSQIVQAPGYVVILREAVANLPSSADIISLNRRPPLPPEIRQWNGDPRGHWEGDTLVVETTNFRGEAGYYGREIPDANPRVIERYTRIGPDTILWEVTTESSSFTRPFTYEVQLKRTKGPMFEFACHEGNRSMANILAGARATERRTGATISGSVRDASGQPMPNASVQLVRLDYHRDGYSVSQMVSNVSANERGEYQIFQVPVGEYYLAAVAPPPTLRTFHPSAVTFAEATPIAVRESQIVSGIDIGMRTRTVKGFTLRGQVNSTGRLVDRPDGVIARIRIIARDVNDPNPISGFGQTPLKAGSGSFEIENILPGAYDLYAEGTDLQNWLTGGAASAVGRIPIEVRDKDIEDISMFIHPSVEVKGTVSDLDRAADRATVRVRLHADGSSVKNPVYAGETQRPVNIRADGSFSIPGIPEGLFRVATEGLPPDAYVADVRQGNRSVNDSGIEVGAVSPEPIQVVLSSGAGTIQGVVQNAAGKPVAFASVALAPELGRRQNPMLYADTISDSDGKFQIRGIAPGEYKLFAWERRLWLGARQNPAFIAKYEGFGRRVTVAERSIVPADITAIPVEQEQPR
jgi:protocatechuate 3,4-dioxygenase beta subunit